MKLFLTGATGFIGKNFCKKALKKGHLIYATTRKNKNFNHKNLVWLKGNFYEDWNKALSNSDLLIHFAAAGVQSDNVQDLYEVNIFQSLKLIKNAISNKCKKWLIISTSSEYGYKKKKTLFNKKTNRIPETNYGLSKAIFSDLCIKLAKKHGCKVRIMRLFSIYGKGENSKRLYPSLLKSIKLKKNFFVNNPNEVRDFTDVNYATNLILDAMNFKKKKFKNSQVWHISNNNPTSIKNFVRNVWRKNEGKNKIYFSKKSSKKYNHISDSKSLWIK